MATVHRPEFIRCMLLGGILDAWDRLGALPGDEWGEYLAAAAHYVRASSNNNEELGLQVAESAVAEIARGLAEGFLDEEDDFYGPRIRQAREELPQLIQWCKQAWGPATDEVYEVSRLLHPSADGISARRAQIEAQLRDIEKARTRLLGLLGAEERGAEVD